MLTGLIIGSGTGLIVGAIFGKYILADATSIKAHITAEVASLKTAFAAEVASLRSKI